MLGVNYSGYKIPLNPPFSKGEIFLAVLNKIPPLKKGDQGGFITIFSISLDNLKLTTRKISANTSSSDCNTCKLSKRKTFNPNPCINVSCLVALHITFFKMLPAIYFNYEFRFWRRNLPQNSLLFFGDKIEYPRFVCVLVETTIMPLHRLNYT
jgi:hypothetical protein